MTSTSKENFREILSPAIAKGAFFSESEIRFSNLPISQKNYSKKLSWAWNLKFPPISVSNLFKFQAQDSFLEYFFWEIWNLKNESHFLKKATFSVNGCRLIKRWYIPQLLFWNFGKFLKRDYIYFYFSDKTLQKYKKKSLLRKWQTWFKSLNFTSIWLFIQWVDLNITSMMKSYSIKSRANSRNQIIYSTFYLLQLKSFASHPKKPSSLNTNQRM